MRNKRITSRLVAVSLIFGFGATVCAQNALPMHDNLKTWIDEGHYRTFEDLQVFVHSSGSCLRAR